MPWCPICQNEYKEGYTHCNDCDADLVASREELPEAVMFGEEADMLKMKEILAEAGIGEVYTVYAKKDKCHELRVAPAQAKEAREQLRNYLEETAKKQMMDEFGVSAEALEDGELLKEIAMDAAAGEASAKKKAVYGDKKVKADDYQSSAVTLALVGGAGLILIVLHALGVIPIQLPQATKIMMYIVMGSLFAIFLVCSALAFKTYRKLLSEDASEKEFIKEAKVFTDSIPSHELDLDGEESDLPEEMKYFKRIAVLKRMIGEKYPDAKEEIVDYLAEEYYDAHFGTDYDTKEADAFLEEEKEDVDA